MFIRGVLLVFQHVKERVRVKWVGWVTETAGTVKSSHTEGQKKMYTSRHILSYSKTSVHLFLMTSKQEHLHIEIQIPDLSSNTSSKQLTKVE